jgi:hypothetical protein
LLPLSFGIVLYELAPGKNPFERSSLAVSMGAVVAGVELRS